MANPTAALQSLLALRKTDPMLDPSLRGNTSAAAYDPMIPEEDLYGIQDLVGAAGAESGGAYTVPSRESLRDSATAKLRQTFGLKAADAEARSAPERIRGQFGLAQEEIKGKYGLESERAKAEAAMTAAQSGRDFNASQAEIASGRTDARQQAGFKNQAGLQQNMFRQQREMAATPLRPKAPAQPSWFSRMFGASTPAAAPAQAFDDALVSDAIQTLQDRPDLSLEDLVAAGTDFSPEELAAIQAQIGQ